LETSQSRKDFPNESATSQKRSVTAFHVKMEGEARGLAGDQISVAASYHVTQPGEAAKIREELTSAVRWVLQRFGFSGTEEVNQEEVMGQCPWSTAESRMPPFEDRKKIR
jgi:hypothetical protein